MVDEYVIDVVWMWVVAVIVMEDKKSLSLRFGVEEKVVPSPRL